MKPRLGFAGLGLMGSPMARRLLEAGYPLAVYNRTREKADPLLELGARWCDTPAMLAESSDSVLSMVSDSKALENISLGNDGILTKLGQGALHIDFSTVSPSTTASLNEQYDSRGAFFVHSPVLGSVPQAREGSLLLFAGGKSTALNIAEPILKVLGSRIWKFDRPEQASHAKLLCNLLIAGMITTLSQALVFARRAGVMQETLLEIISHSALNAPMYQTKGRSIIERNFSPRFYLEHMLKDINLMMDAAHALDVSLPGISASQQLFQEAAERGYAREDYSSVIKILEEMAGGDA